SNSFSRGRLYDFASTQVAQRISIVSGVSRVDVFGTKGAVRIKVNPDALTARDLSIDDIADAVRGGTSTVGAGQLDSPIGTFLVNPQGQLDAAASYANLVIKSRTGASVRLGDVSQVVDSVENERMSMRFWDRDIGTLPKATVVLAVNRQAGANAVEVAQN